MLAIANLVNDNCQPNEGGVGACVMFGGYVGNTEHSPVHDAVAMGWLALFGAPLALGIFVIYAIIAIVIGVRSGKRLPTSVQ